MKTAITIAAALVTLLVPAGAARAQWGGIAAVASSQGYSAAPGMGMAVPVPAEPEVAPSVEERIEAPALPRPHAPRMTVAEVRADHRTRPRIHIARAAAQHRPAMVARAKRPLSRRHARFA